MERREILFRGWNEKNKKWLYGYYVVNGGEHFISPGAFVNDLEFYEDYVVEADTVGQYTGMKDAKGVKIFEGDIIGGDGCIHFIQYNDKEAQFVAVDRYIQCGISQRLIDEFEKVIIGNVHENKNLIKTE